MCLLYQCIRQSLLYVILSATRKHQPNIVLDTLQYNVVFLQGSFTVFFFFFFFRDIVPLALVLPFITA